MRLLKLAVSLIVLTLAACTSQPPALDFGSLNDPNPITLFDDNWRFSRGDPKDAQSPAFNDIDWQPINVPHDWSIAGPYDPNATTLRGGGYLPAGIAWYRKTFPTPYLPFAQRVYLDFDGVMANSEIFLNGVSLAKRPYGYISFRVDLTDHLNKTQFGSNTLAVRCDNTAQPASRSYAGAGIYRHTRLVIRPSVRIDHWATQITTPKVAAEQATIRIKTTLINNLPTPSPVSLSINIHDGPSDIKTINLPQKEIPAGQSADFEIECLIPRPHLWDIADPHLYTASITVQPKNDDSTTESTPFGIRSFEFKPDTGFHLNGKNLKLKGVCLHHDGGAVGAAVPLSIWERRLQSLRDLGVNAIRTAHNPVAPEFLDLCDRMGFLVMEESFDTWTAAKPNGGQGYNRLFNQWAKEDTRDMVLRDRNHPSIILWSCGNEIRDNLASPAGRDRFIMLRDIYHQLDPLESGGRPVTFALFRPNTMGVYNPGGFGELMDIIGQNYNEADLTAAFRQNPARKVIGTENQHGVAVWRVLRDNPFMAGQFLWTGYDYLGESDWPRIGTQSGLFDRTGLPHTRAYERQSWWSEKPMVAFARRESFTPPPSTNPAIVAPAAPTYVTNYTPKNPATYTQVDLQVYSNCEEVELLLNNKSLGTKPLNADATPRTWQFPYEPGTLKALGKNKGQTIATFEQKTAGPPTKLQLTSDRTTLPPNNFEEVAFIRVAAIDANNTLNPNATLPITFTLTGPAQLIALDNADPFSHESYQSTQHQLHNGQALAILRATGTGPITLTATTPNLPPTTITLNKSP